MRKHGRHAIIRSDRSDPSWRKRWAQGGWRYRAPTYERDTTTGIHGWMIDGKPCPPTDFPHPDRPVPYAADEFLGPDTLGEATKRQGLWDNCAQYDKLEV